MLHSFTVRFLYLLACSMLLAQCYANELPKIQLATPYKTDMKNPISINEYFVSEKLDGIRGYWNGKNLFTRGGNLIHAPEWFTLGWPKIHLDGELWSNRGEFEKISSCVRKHQPAPKNKMSCWHKIRFMVFDLPKHAGTFSQRITQMNNLIASTSSHYWQTIKQEKINSIALLHQRLANIVNIGGEGLMLHHQAAYYNVGRSHDLMKLKQHDDAEAIVIAHIKGKGKYKNKMGSLKVKMPSGLTFKIGSGFTDKQREKPPAIGSTVTYKYIGKTARGVPKFASFLRIRELTLIQ
jgi:DNA ligase-1